MDSFNTIYFLLLHGIWIVLVTIVVTDVYTYFDCRISIILRMTCRKIKAQLKLKDKELHVYVN